MALSSSLSVRRLQIAELLRELEKKLRGKLERCTRTLLAERSALEVLCTLAAREGRAVGAQEKAAIAQLGDSLSLAKEFSSLVEEFQVALEQKANFEAFIAAALSWITTQTTLSWTPFAPQLALAEGLTSLGWTAERAEKFIWTRIENQAYHLALKRRLLEEVEVVGKRVEFDPEVFRAHLEAHTRLVQAIAPDTEVTFCALIAEGVGEAIKSETPNVDDTRLAVFCIEF